MFKNNKKAWYTVKSSKNYKTIILEFSEKMSEF